MAPRPDPPTSIDPVAEAMELRSFTGVPREFWPRFLQLVVRSVNPRRVVLLCQESSPSKAWRVLADWTHPSGSPQPVGQLAALLESLAARALEGNGSFRIPLDPSPSSRLHAVTQRLHLLRPEEVAVAVVLWEAATAEEVEGHREKLRWFSDIPQAYQKVSSTRQATQDVQRLVTVLDVVAATQGATRFKAATFALCNELATRMDCERVSLGWHHEGNLILETISRTEHLDRKMAAVQALETVMEECLDQDDELAIPPFPDTSTVHREHQRFVDQHQSGHLLSVPVRFHSGVVAVLTCERLASPFTAGEARQLRLIADHVVHRLDQLRRTDVWWGKRMVRSARETAAGWLGPRHTWAKLTAVLVALLLLALMIIRVEYRVSGTFILRSQELTHVTAPFDGFLREVRHRPGDDLAQGEVLLKLDTVDLELELAASRAEQARFLREAEKARAARNLGDMRIAQSQADQTAARIQLLEYRLAQAQIKAPFSGVLVEGDLRDRIGAPVKQGDALLKLARTDHMYVEAEISEQDVHLLKDQATGRIAFLSRPDQTFLVKSEMIEPAATQRNAANVFLVRCQLAEGAQSWWRPGMTGVIRMHAEKRSLLWILTRRTVDYLRLRLWW